MTTGIHPKCEALGHRRLGSVRESLSEDIRRYLDKSPENQAVGDTLKSRAGAFLTPELLCIFLHRIAHFLYTNRWKASAAMVSRLNFLLHKVSIAPQSCIGAGLRLPHPAGVTFWGRAGRGVTLYSMSVCCPREWSLTGPAEAGPTLGERVSVGGHAVLLGPIRVGENTKIGFRVRLESDAPAGVLVVSSAMRARWGAPSTPAAGVARASGS